MHTDSTQIAPGQLWINNRISRIHIRNDDDDCGYRPLFKQFTLYSSVIHCHISQPLESIQHIEKCHYYHSCGLPSTRLSGSTYTDEGCGEQRGAGAGGVCVCFGGVGNDPMPRVAICKRKALILAMQQSGSWRASGWTKVAECLWAKSEKAKGFARCTLQHRPWCWGQTKFFTVGPPLIACRATALGSIHGHVKGYSPSYNYNALQQSYSNVPQLKNSNDLHHIAILFS